jgi:hypothetical protein
MTRDFGDASVAPAVATAGSDCIAGCPLTACGSPLAASTTRGLGGRFVAGDGRLAKNVRGRLPAPVGAVEVGVEADEGEVVLLGRDVLVGVIEAQSRRLGGPADRELVFGLKPYHRDCSGEEQVFDKANEAGMELAAQEHDANRVDAELGDKQRLVGNDAQKALDIVGLLLVQQEFKKDTRVKLVGHSSPPLAHLVLEFYRGVLVAHVPKKTSPVEAHLAGGLLCLFLL